MGRAGWLKSTSMDISNWRNKWGQQLFYTREDHALNVKPFTGIQRVKTCFFYSVRIISRCDVYLMEFLVFGQHTDITYHTSRLINTILCTCQVCFSGNSVIFCLDLRKNWDHGFAVRLLAIIKCTMLVRPRRTFDLFFCVRFKASACNWLAFCPNCSNFLYVFNVFVVQLFSLS